MRMKMAFAAAAGLTLVSAHPPQTDQASEGSYPPCSRTVTDRCNQIRERVARSASEAPKRREAAATIESADPDDIDVTYAGDLRPARSGTVQSGPAVVQRQAAPRTAPEAQAQARIPDRPAPAHRVRVEQLAVNPSAASYPACRSGITDRCQQQRAGKPARQMSARVKRAGERG